MNPMLLCDAYKLGHMEQYPEGTTLVYSNFTARNFKHMEKVYPIKKMVFFGVSAVVRQMLELWDDEFFCKSYKEVKEDFQRKAGHFVKADWVGYKYFEELHEVGYLPLIIRTLPEGAKVGPNVPVLTIENELPAFFWLTNFVETYLSAELWKMSTAATIANVYREILLKYARTTGSPEEFVDWQGHDFSYRGLSCSEDAAKTGAAHLTSFLGTDTLPAIDYLWKNYCGDSIFLGSSVFGSEHSVMSAGGKDTEFETYERLLTKVYPSGIVSIVSDTWDLWNVLENFMPRLKDVIMNRTPDANGFAKCVIRPDSGSPVDIICGNPDAPVGSAERKGVIQCLWDVFGGTITSTGHKLLDSHIGAIYGDSITTHICEDILELLHQKGFASANMVFGIGSFTYNYTTRDTLGFAMKATLTENDKGLMELSKDPITDKTKTKKSAKGLLSVIKDDKGDYILLDQLSERHPEDCLIEDGWVERDLGKIRARVRES
jgi:nicotinamide phosphoribosyltransferase